ncbi:unnamed protein product [Ranitomeya imitator]|uniref:Uncharacterized protein n=1 Tax=Ranitomeya imitator TaxID=111125 RepID=A0ABN9LTW9_9NEOB|nr:unnamed protein product [Ranitomeya imitator]
MTGRCWLTEDLPIRSVLPVQKGFFISPPYCCPDVQTRLCEVLMADGEDIQLCSYSTEEEHIWQHLWQLDGEAKETTRSRVFRVEEPMSSPFVDTIKGSAVFYSLQDACEVLEECSSVIPEAQKVLASMEPHRIPDRGRFPIIAIEGLDATGKNIY